MLLAIAVVFSTASLLICEFTGLVWGALAKEKLARLNKHNALIEVLNTENRLACCDLLQVKGREAQS
ncbi:hypothetical protein BFV96_1499 [Alteromonas macleodii]|nr:hypothetical protein BFV93_1495 [Alteromonas macleodii]OES42797.1 hypothetical protein BFV96_1499 [Alteromonas macleodii]